MMSGNTIPGRKPASRLLCTLTHPQNPGQLWAKAGIHGSDARATAKWVPAFAGMTNFIGGR
jgi:hypothetical protein